VCWGDVFRRDQYGCSCPSDSMHVGVWVRLSQCVCMCGSVCLDVPLSLKGPVFAPDSAMNREWGDWKVFSFAFFCHTPQKVWCRYGGNNLKAGKQTPSLHCGEVGCLSGSVRRLHEPTCVCVSTQVPLLSEVHIILPASHPCSLTL
jgi:hypothetical protein